MEYEIVELSDFRQLTFRMSRLAREACADDEESHRDVILRARLPIHTRVSVQEWLLRVAESFYAGMGPADGTDYAIEVLYRLPADPQYDFRATGRHRAYVPVPLLEQLRALDTVLCLGA